MARLLEGFAVKAIGLGLAVYVGSHAGIAITDLYGRVNAILQGVM